MTLLQITKRKRPASEQSEAFVKKLTQGEPAQHAATGDDAAALRKKLGTDTKPIAQPKTPPAAIAPPPAPEPAIEPPAQHVEKPSPPERATTTPDHPAYKGERERITGRFKSELVVKLDAIGLLSIEDRNSIIERVLEGWVEKEWTRLMTANGKADLEFAYGRARAALEKKRGR